MSFELGADLGPAIWVPRLRRWTRVLSAYFGTQILTQLLAIGAGLLFINFMPVGDFALYTLALSVGNFLSLASEFGSSSSLLYFYHRASETAEDYRPYLAAVVSLRRIAFVAGVPVTAAWLILNARSRSFGMGEAALAALAVLVGVWFQIDASTRIADLRLTDRFGRAYRADVAAALFRLVLACGLVATGWLAGWLGVASNAGGAAVCRAAAGGRAAEAPGRLDLRPYRRAVLRYLAPTLPSAFYYAMQGPLVVWLAATFGASRNIAEVGALGRLGLIVGMFSGLVGVVFLPRLAATADPTVYRRRYLQFGAIVALLAGLLLGAALTAPDWFLFVLGRNYAGLYDELYLVVAAAAVNLVGAYLVGVNNARAWTRWQGLATATLVLAQAVLVALLPLDSSAGVLRFNLISALVATGTQVPVAVLGFWKPGVVRWR